ncbi:hypothetical protein HYH03_015371 [Edaphochlamys debaryana]|uniref:Uncharacterized protein n=1 Tax=Edaphochlamys debaryana TaxID=47281 RepID=A0A835XJK2_9CHLO|nr:hypothetical protein HYH03_015371 [Edaphochlamys debaryana]|eukprot:KAG2485927.1 hypothetical protein HYH03_015371 [Edaphochlamys debaryana]
MDGRQLTDEFRAVIGRDHSIRHTYSDAQAPGNAPKNRYVNVLPYDHNRVLLRPCSAGALAPGPEAANGSLGAQHAANGARVPRSGPAACAAGPGAVSASGSGSGSDYINASHVVHCDDCCGFQLGYIACQGPLAATVPDFWRMVWTEGVGAVVMLTNTVERGVTKCSPYYPAAQGSRLQLRGPGAAPQGQGGSRAAAGGQGGCGCAAPSAACVEAVVAEASQGLHGGDLTYTQLCLLPAAEGAGAGPEGAGPGPQPRVVAHLRYNAWPDHGTPADAAAIRTLLDMLAPVRAAGRGVVVHCSAGIGRTGTFCAIDILRRRLGVLEQRAAERPGSVSAAEVQAALDLPELVHSLRRQRGGMVQTLEQYAFCYQAVAEELAEGLEGPAGGAEGGTPRARAY